MLLRMLTTQYGCVSLEDKRVLEVGCGSGTWLLEFIRWGARPENLWGIDLLPERIDVASYICPPGVNLQCGNGAELQMPDGFFDLVLQSTVFTSILAYELKKQVANEMLRVLKKQGLIIWYDFMVDNPRNPDVRGINKKEIKKLFPECRIELKKITLAPPLARLVASAFPLSYHALSAIKLLCTHYLALIEKL